MKRCSPISRFSNPRNPDATLQPRARSAGRQRSLSSARVVQRGEIQKKTRSGVTLTKRSYRISSCVGDIGCARAKPIRLWSLDSTPCLSLVCLQGHLIVTRGRSSLSFDGSYVLIEHFTVLVMKRSLGLRATWAGSVHLGLLEVLDQVSPTGKEHSCCDDDETNLGCPPRQFQM